MSIHRAAFLVIPILAALACESATNLDVSYAAPDAGGDAPLGGGDADSDSAAPGPIALEGCPCDPSAGLGCCVTAKDAFCTDDHAVCTAAKGEYIRCARRDPSSDSECCWHGSGAGATTGLASSCDAGPPACLTDQDCIGAAQPTCKTTTCAGFTFGQCGSNAPVCP